MTGVLARSTISDLPAKEDRMMPNIDSIITDHVALTVRWLDRIYLQGYMPKLQTSGGLCYFLRDHLGHPIPSPALFRPMHDRRDQDVRRGSRGAAHRIQVRPRQRRDRRHP